ncbi:MAG: hypothetical protein PHY64_00485 [Eubacteriales bacterium]|nr:hypothetical protein [Eubacteriales bacterium]
MKKLSCILVIVLVLMSLVIATACAADDTTNYQFSFTAGSANGTSSDFGFSGNYKKKLSTKTYIEVRHSVTQSAAGYTNLIAADRQGGNYIGSKWMASNSVYYSTNGGCVQNAYYAPCGRGNTRYADNYGLTSVTIAGQFRVH